MVRTTHVYSKVGVEQGLESELRTSRVANGKSRLEIILPQGDRVGDAEFVVLPFGRHVFIEHFIGEPKVELHRRVAGVLASGRFRGGFAQVLPCRNASEAMLGKV